jgi:flagellar motor protein MotB
MSAHPEIVIIRRRSVHEDAAHHGGAWKIAFADFMTAMMAFFLVLWIISATDKNTKTLIARYFNPVRVEEPAKAQKGIHGAPEQDTDAPGTEAGAPNALKPRSDQGETASGSVRESSTSPVTEAKGKHLAKQDPKTPPDPSKPNPTMTEEELFSDPRASLDKIAGVPPPGPRVDPSATLKGYGEVGPSADEALRDPFRPLGSDMAINVVTPDSGAQLPVGPTVEEPNQPTEASHPVPPETLQQHPVKKESNPPSDVAPEQTKAEVAQAPQARAVDPARAQAVAAAALLADVKARVGPEGQSLAGPELDVQARDATRSAMLTRQYATRFGASLYAADFFRELARMIARFGLADDPDNYQLLSDAAASLPPDALRDFLLTLAKAAIVNARFGAAAAAAAQVLKSAPKESLEEARGRLYLDASRLFSDGYAAARADLEVIAATKLDRSDAGLLASIRSVAAQLGTTPSAGAIAAQGVEPVDNKEARGPQQTIGLAVEALKRTEQTVAAGQGGGP